MSNYQLPRTSINTYKNLFFDSTQDIPKVVISNSLSYYLSNIKQKITNKEKYWDMYKKYTNPYEYIHTQVPVKKKSVSKHKPLSRSYFKMIELIYMFDIATTITREKIQTFHLAEGPGGFIEAICKINGCNQENRFYGMSLLDDNNDNNIPAWKKSNHFLRDNPNVFIESGKDGTGNILSVDNFHHVVEKYGNTMDIVTADGGFDFSIDFNQQEIFIAKLLFAQVAYAINLQKKGGIFILKIFDCFMMHTIDILYLLSSFYENVYIIKPHTSRYGNSEKYVVCIGFLFDTNKDFFPYIDECFSDMCETDDTMNVARFLKMDIPYYFLQRVEELNAIYGQKQIQNIHYTLSLMENKNKNEKIEILVKTNIQKCVEWCIKYNEPYNQLMNSTNIFLNNFTVFSSDAFQHKVYT